MQELEFDIRGMTCDSCTNHVETALRRVQGVVSAEVPGWNSGRAVVRAENGVDLADLTEAVERAGYGAKIQDRSESGTARNERTNGDFDLMIIGGGSAGFAAAIKGAELGAKVAMVEADTIGGTCVNWGCVPSKNLIRAVDRYHQAGESRFRGVETRQTSLSWPEVIDQKDELVREMRQVRYVDVLDAYPEVTYIHDRATLVSAQEVEIRDQLYSPWKILIATGARPWAPPIPGLKEAGYLDSTSAMDLREVPKSLVVMGGNAVGLELAQIYARAGSEVTVVELVERIAPFEEPEISDRLAEYLTAEGLKILTNFETQDVRKSEGTYFISGSAGGERLTIEADQLLVATGRRANTEGFGLEQVGVHLGDQGQVLTDSSLQSSNPNVYAAGDVLGENMYVYTAAYGGIVAAENALSGASRTYETDYIPRITFSDPQIASAGITEAQAVDKGRNVKVTVMEMEHVASAQAARDTRGLIKLVADADTDRLLGAHILAPHAGEMIQTAVLAIRFGIRVKELRETMFPYLTQVEGIKLAALSFDKDPALLSCCAG